MMDNREKILRLNVERFERMLGTEADPGRRRTLDLLLIETHAELEFLAESRKFAAGLPAGRAGDERISVLRAKAQECRRIAGTCGRRSTREVLLRLAADYEAMAEDTKRARAPGGSDPDRSR